MLIGTGIGAGIGLGGGLLGGLAIGRNVRNIRSSNRKAERANLSRQYEQDLRNPNERIFLEVENRIGLTKWFGYGKRSFIRTHGKEKDSSRQLRRGDKVVVSKNSYVNSFRKDDPSKFSQSALGLRKRHVYGAKTTARTKGDIDNNNTDLSKAGWINRGKLKEMRADRNKKKNKSKTGKKSSFESMHN